MGARTPVLEALHLWVLLAYSGALFVLAVCCWVGARLVRRSHERLNDLESTCSLYRVPASFSKGSATPCASNSATRAASNARTCVGRSKRAQQAS